MDNVWTHGGTAKTVGLEEGEIFFHCGANALQILPFPYPTSPSLTNDVCSVASNHAELLHPSLIALVSHFCLLSGNADEKCTELLIARTIFAHNTAFLQRSPLLQAQLSQVALTSCQELTKAATCPQHSPASPGGCSETTRIWQHAEHMGQTGTVCFSPWFCPQEKHFSCFQFHHRKLMLVAKCSCNQQEWEHIRFLDWEHQRSSSTLITDGCFCITIRGWI